MHPDFDPQPVLSDPRLHLRPLHATDLEPLFAVASDPLIWAGHPAKNRHQRAVFEPYFATLLASGGTLAICSTDGDQIIGCSRYYTPPEDPHGVAIGYTFLGRDWWGGVTNVAMKKLMLDHAFQTVDAVWLHIDPTNLRSQRATAKLGAIMVSEGSLILGGRQDVWQSWRIEKATWETRA